WGRGGWPAPPWVRRAATNGWGASSRPMTGGRRPARKRDEASAWGAYTPAAHRYSDAIAAVECAAAGAADRPRGSRRGRKRALNRGRRSEYLAHRRFGDRQTQSRLAWD